MSGDELWRHTEAREAPRYRTLYPPLKPYDSGLLLVDKEVGHRIHYEQCGNPEGLAALFVHGGPGVGSGPACRRFFNPQVYRIVVFSQRGAGRSTPAGCLVNNTTPHLVSDIEALRQHLRIPVWHVLLGGSWGASLAVAYAEAHAARVRCLVLRGVFLGAPEEIRWLFERGGASEHYPDAFDRYESYVTEAERGNLIEAYYRRLTHSDPRVRREAALRFVGWEESISKVQPYKPREIHEDLVANAAFIEAFARIECHYMRNGCFLRPGQLLRNAAAMGKVATHIVHGRLDLVCRPRTAYALHKALPRSSLAFIHDAGHSVEEVGILDAVMRAVDAAATRAITARLPPQPTLDAGTDDTDAVAGARQVERQAKAKAKARVRARTRGRGTPNGGGGDGAGGGVPSMVAGRPHTNASPRGGSVSVLVHPPTGGGTTGPGAGYAGSHALGATDASPAIAATGGRSGGGGAGGGRAPKPRVVRGRARARSADTVTVPSRLGVHAAWARPALPPTPWAPRRTAAKPTTTPTAVTGAGAGLEGAGGSGVSTSIWPAPPSPPARGSALGGTYSAAVAPATAAGAGRDESSGFAAAGHGHAYGSGPGSGSHSHARARPPAAAMRASSPVHSLDGEEHLDGVRMQEVPEAVSIAALLGHSAAGAGRGDHARATST